MQFIWKFVKRPPELDFSNSTSLSLASNCLQVQLKCKESAIDAGDLTLSFRSVQKALLRNSGSRAQISAKNRERRELQEQVLDLQAACASAKQEAAAARASEAEATTRANEAERIG